MFNPCFVRGFTFLPFFFSLVATAQSQQIVLIVVGAEGSPEYGPQFRQWADQWQAAAKRGGADFQAIGLELADNKTDKDLLQQRCAEMAGPGDAPVWLVLIGHGTFDGKTARFNLRGPDVTPAELAQWTRPIERPLAIVNCASSSGPFLAELSGPGRAVVAATKSGHETNFARFGQHLAAAIADPRADLDKDEQTSLLEAFLLASARTREFYASESRLATEHALLDDNGDKLGTPADWFQGLRPAKAAKEGAPLDGTQARRFVLVPSSREEQLSLPPKMRRDALERELAGLRLKKSQLSEADYLNLLEPLLVELSRLYEQ